MVANRLRRELPTASWSVVCVDRDPDHHYQPGYLYLPFGAGRQEEILRPKKDLLCPGIQLIIDEVSGVDVDGRSVQTRGGGTLSYDFLVLSTGCRIAPEEVDGLEEIWRKTAFDFYTLDGARALGEAMQAFTGGRLVIDIAEVPYKCPITPMEFAYLADDYLSRRGIRDRTEIVLATPLSKLLHLSDAADALDELCRTKGVEVLTDFSLSSVQGGKLEELGGASRVVDFDLLVSIPPNLGDELMEETGLDEGNAGYVPTDPHTLKARSHDRIYVIGDGTDLPTSKAGSVAHFCAPVLEQNLLAEIRGEEPDARFDGHTNCFIETGGGKALMIDFAYDIDALPGTFPFPVVGPFSLLRATRINHWGKVAFRPMYWHMLMPGRPMPLPHHFSMTGKQTTT